METLLYSIVIVELVVLQYLIIVLLFLLACPACPKSSTIFHPVPSLFV